ncbi:hypothetical protein HYT01_04275 [Candidatus Giovannonibacteria bacterium]|nr:hypothetical protein [Candidatus Giovannonibacteria bacterium]
MTNIKEELKEKMQGYMAAALGLVAGLAWNDAIKALIEYLFPIQKNGILIKFIYAIIITLIVVVITVNLTRFFNKKEK